MAVSDRELAISAAEEAEFVMSFIEASDKVRVPYQEIWRETLTNYLVRPYQDTAPMGQVQYPYLTDREDFRSNSGSARLKDPESHQIVEALLAELENLIYPDRSFVRSRPVGFEDARRSNCVNRLMEYMIRLEGHRRTLHEWHKDGFIFGTGILEGYWYYREEERVQRMISYQAGFEISEELLVMMPVYDDFRMRPVDIQDFFPDPGRVRMSDFLGAAKRFQTYARESRNNPNWDRGAVERAIRNSAASDAREQRDQSYREYLDRPALKDAKVHPDFVPMVGYCYYGEVPYKPRDGARRRRIEVINGEVVRSAPWRKRIPFFDFSVCPVQGRFYGLSPLEVIRYKQDFVDGILMLTADSAVKAADPPHAVLRDANIDVSAFKKFRGKYPVLIDRPDGIQQIMYNPPLRDAYEVYNRTIAQMRSGSGALGVLQGLGLGVDRASATEASGTFQQARGRPEALARLTEREYLPPLAQFALGEYQEYLEDTEALLQRVGEQPEPVFLKDINGQFDIEFVGSRTEGTRQEALASYRELFALGANPIANAMVPWPQVLQQFLSEMGLHEPAQHIGEMFMAQMAMQQMQGGLNPMAGNGNGTSPALPPTEAPMEQTGGMALE